MVQLDRRLVYLLKKLLSLILVPLDREERPSVTKVVTIFFLLKIKLGIHDSKAFSLEFFTAVTYTTDFTFLALNRFNHLQITWS